ncbi:serine protease [Alteromonas sp. K632G]|uniref:S1 family peptidase n=1 Tax=Alteromonas sp. K632G TaxID=2820757 RepID=UPI001FCA9BDA|nr:serine protease [Alteromonas sp. K632G]
MRYLVIIGLLFSSVVKAEKTFTNIVEIVTKSTVAVAYVAPIESKAAQIMGTGFVVGNGEWLITNYHVVDRQLDPSIISYFAAVIGFGTKTANIKAELVSIDPHHDLALLKLNKKLPPLKLASITLLKPGEEIAFTGFPIGSVLGVYPATHRGIISALTPDTLPVARAKQLSSINISRLASPGIAYQLDATAFPGNSGSPMYNPSTGEVVGVINKVFVSDGKESVLTNPSGITYAIPVEHVIKLLKNQGVRLN